MIELKARRRGNLNFATDNADHSREEFDMCAFAYIYISELAQNHFSSTSRANFDDFGLAEASLGRETINLSACTFGRVRLGNVENNLLVYFRKINLMERR